MITKKQLKNYAKLAIKIGVNLQKGQELVINAPVECADFARLAAEQAYKAGAKRVWMKWNDDTISRLGMKHQNKKTLADIPQFVIDEAHYQVDNNVAYLFVAATDPELYKGIDSEKLKISHMARVKALKFSMDARSSNHNRWTIVSVPTLSWAKKIFPDARTGKEAVNRLWDGIIKSMRLDEENPIEAWNAHVARLTSRAAFLNKNDFEAIELKNKLGTNLRVGLVKEHIWLAAGEDAQDGVYFVANMPTEEVFTAPDKNNVNGTLVNALPLCHNGNIIDKFRLTFENGRITDYSAEVGYETLKQAIETDEGSHHLGEIALIGKHSPIAMQNILFYNTLFDENASCHLAIGASYPTTIKNGNSYSDEEMDKRGMNTSFNHIDFMIGTPDMEIWGVKKDGTRIQLFNDGDWII